MSHKTRIGEEQTLQEGALPLTPRASSGGRSRGSAQSPRPAARKASRDTRTGSSRRSASLSRDVLKDAAEVRALAASAVPRAKSEAAPKQAPVARKGVARKKKASPASAVTRRSSTRNAWSRQEPAPLDNLTPKTRAGAGSGSEKASASEGNGHFEHEEIARLAYSSWEARGCQGGSPEEDWFRAQAEVRLRKENLKKTRAHSGARRAQKKGRA